MFCTAQTLLRITLRHPRWRRFFSLARKGQTRAAFAELNVLAEAMDGGCEACGAALRLSHCIKETVSGLGSLLYICCSNSECGETNICRTNKTHRSTGTTRGRPIFDVNTKLAAGIFTFNDVKILFSTLKHPFNIQPTFQ